MQRETTVPRRFVEYVEPREPRYRGPVVVVAGHWTGSMGEGITIGMHALGVHVIASDMGDLLGGIYNVDLESAPVRMDIGAEALFHVDGTPREDFRADTPLASSDRDSEGNDPALAAAIEWLTQRE